MKTYRATVTRDGKFWLIRVAKIRRVTQARHLRELEPMTTDLIAVMTAESPGSFSVEFDIQLPKTVRAHLQAARALRQKAARAQAGAAAEARQAARALRAQGIPLRDIGRALGISYQRAHQLAS